MTSANRRRFRRSICGEWADSNGCKGVASLEMLMSANLPHVRPQPSSLLVADSGEDTSRRKVGVGTGSIAGF